MPMVARIDARTREQKYNNWAAELMARGRRWSEEDVRHWHDEYEAVKKEWDEAEKLSFDSGYGFFDRYGTWREGSKPDFITQVIDNYLRAYPDKYRKLEKKVPSANNEAVRQHVSPVQPPPPWKQAAKSQPVPPWKRDSKRDTSWHSRSGWN